MLDLALNSITKRHERIIKDTYDCSPTATLQQIADSLEEMPEMATCFVTITVEFLLSLGYAERKPQVQADEPDDDDDAATAAETPRAAGLSASVLRSQLETRHNSIEKRITELLKSDVLSPTQTKMFQMLATIDEKLVSQILDMMNQEAAPLIAQAIIIRCLLRLGVLEKDLLWIEDILSHPDINDG